MKFTNQTSGVAMWVALTAAGLLTATYLGRRRGKRRVGDVAHDVAGATQADQTVDDTIEDSFPASDPPAWSSVSGARSE